MAQTVSELQQVLADAVRETAGALFEAAYLEIVLVDGKAKTRLLVEYPRAMARAKLPVPRPTVRKLEALYRAVRMDRGYGFAAARVTVLGSGETEIALEPGPLPDFIPSTPAAEGSVVMPSLAPPGAVLATSEGDAEWAQPPPRARPQPADLTPGPDEPADPLSTMRETLGLRPEPGVITYRLDAPILALELRYGNDPPQALPTDAVIPLAQILHQADGHDPLEGRVQLPSDPERPVTLAPPEVVGEEISPARQRLIDQLTRDTQGPIAALALSVLRDGRQPTEAIWFVLAADDPQPRTLYAEEDRALVADVSAEELAHLFTSLRETLADSALDASHILVGFQPNGRYGPLFIEDPAAPAIRPPLSEPIPNDESEPEAAPVLEAEPVPDDEKVAEPETRLESEPLEVTGPEDGEQTDGTDPPVSTETHDTAGVSEDPLQPYDPPAPTTADTRDTQKTDTPSEPPAVATEPIARNVPAPARPIASNAPAPAPVNANTAPTVETTPPVQGRGDPAEMWLDTVSASLGSALDDLHPNWQQATLSWRVDGPILQLRLDVGGHLTPMPIPAALTFYRLLQHLHAVSGTTGTLVQNRGKLANLSLEPPDADGEEALYDTRIDAMRALQREAALPMAALARAVLTDNQRPAAPFWLMASPEGNLRVLADNLSDPLITLLAPSAVGAALSDLMRVVHPSRFAVSTLLVGFHPNGAVRALMLEDLGAGVAGLLAAAQPPPAGALLPVDSLSPALSEYVRYLDEDAAARQFDPPSYRLSIVWSPDVLDLDATAIQADGTPQTDPELGGPWRYYSAPISEILAPEALAERYGTLDTAAALCITRTAEGVVLEDGPDSLSDRLATAWALSRQLADAPDSATETLSALLTSAQTQVQQAGHLSEGEVLTVGVKLAPSVCSIYLSLVDPQGQPRAVDGIDIESVAEQVLAVLGALPTGPEGEIPVSGFYAEVQGDAQSLVFVRDAWIPPVGRDGLDQVPVEIG